MQGDAQYAGGWSVCGVVLNLKEGAQADEAVVIIKDQKARVSVHAVSDNVIYE